MADVISRPCLKCGQLLPIDQFYKNSKGKYGRTSRCKHCIKANEQQYMASMSEDQRQRYEDYQRKYRKRNAERIKERMRGYNSTPETRRRAYAYIVQWRKDNPERQRGLSQRRRAAKAGGLTAAEMAEWLKRQKKVCHWCGVKCAADYHVDHIVPLARGGRHERHNLAISCPPCNLRKSARDPIEWAQSIGKLL